MTPPLLRFTMLQLEPNPAQISLLPVVYLSLREEGADERVRAVLLAHVKHVGRRFRLDVCATQKATRLDHTIFFFFFFPCVFFDTIFRNH
jgi:hypothetical protein